MTTYEKIVKGATKLKLAAPKAKYIEPILIVTHSARDSHDEDFRVIMNTLSHRLQDSAWTVVFKSLLVIHIMIREGEGDMTLQYLSKHYKMLDPRNVSKSSGGMTGSDIRAVRAYSKYLTAKAREYSATRVDYVRDERLHNSVSKNEESGGRLRKLGVEKGVLREVESVQHQIDALLRCKFEENEVNNDVILTAFRMLVHDLLSLYQCLNEGVINILEHYFEMSKVDATRALDIYKAFADQTKDVVSYLRIAKRLEYATKLHVPTIKHAPTALTNSLEEYLNDPNFENNRKVYLAEQNGKKTTGSSANLLRDSNGNGVAKNTQPAVQQPAQAQQQAFSFVPQQQQQLPQATGIVMQQVTGFNPWGFTVQQNNAAVPVQQPQATSVFQQPASSQFQQQQQQQQQQQPLQSLPTNNNIFASSATTPPAAMAPQQEPAATGAPNLIPIQKTGVTVQPGNLVPLQASTTGVAQPQSTTQQQQNIQPQSTGFFSQRPNSMITPAFTGAGFGGFGSQPVQAQATANPFNATAPLQHAATGFTSQPAFSGQQQQPLRPQYTSTQTSMSRTKTNPFALGNIPESKPAESASKPVDPTANPFSSSTASKRNTMPLSVMHTGTNPFRNDAAPAGQQPLKPQMTAGGLENLQTVPVFPETQRDYRDQQAQMKAGFELEQQKLALQQQQQQQQQQMQQNGFQQQFTGYQAGFQPQQTGFQQTGIQQQMTARPQSFAGFAPQQVQPTATGNPFLQQQQQQQQQSMATGNPFQSQQQMYGNGPSLI